MGTWRILQMLIQKQTKSLDHKSSILFRTRMANLWHVCHSWHAMKYFRHGTVREVISGNSSDFQCDSVESNFRYFPKNGRKFSIIFRENYQKEFEFQIDWNISKLSQKTFNLRIYLMIDWLSHIHQNQIPWHY